MHTRPELLNERLLACNVAPRRAKRFGKRAHEDVRVAGTDVEVVTDATPLGTHCTNRMRFVNVEIELEHPLIEI